MDAVHAAPHLPIDVQAIGTDFLACSAYKFFGPHVGVLYGRREVLDALPTYKLRPASDRFETGTVNFEGIAGARAAVEYIAEIGRRFGAAFGAQFPGMTGRRLEAHAGMAAIRAYEMPLFGRLLDGLEAIPGAKVWGITDRSRFAERTPTAAVTFAGVTPEAVATALGRPRDRDLVGRLLRDGRHRAAGPGAGGRAPDRPDALQHGGRGGPAAGRARGRSPRGADRPLGPGRLSRPPGASGSGPTGRSRCCAGGTPGHRRAAIARCGSSGHKGSARLCPR